MAGRERGAAGEPLAKGEAPAPLTPAQRHAAELAAEGRRQQAGARAAEEAESRRIGRQGRREVERLGRANVCGTLLESPRGARVQLHDRHLGRRAHASHGRLSSLHASAR